MPGHPQNVQGIKGKLVMTEGITMELIQLIDSKFLHISNKLDESERRSSDSRKEVHKQLGVQGRDLVDIKHRLTTVEKAVEEGKPTLDEFKEIKAKIQGGGILTKVLWIIGVPLIGAALWIVLRWHSFIVAIKAFNGK